MDMQSKVKNLVEINKTQPEQRTSEWFELRKNCITASNASCLLSKSEWVCKEYIDNFPAILKKYPNFINDNEWANPYQSKNDYILQKCGKGKPFEGNIATEWGNKYEKIVTNFYENLTGKKVLDFGLMPHNNLEWIKASPDGITEDGTMLEIKVPYRRKLDGIIPFYYWIQVQIQLEVCDLEECDYIECKISELSKEKYESSPFPKGYLFQNKSEFIHFFDNNHEEVIQKEQKKITFFVISEYEIMKIKRERGWFDKVKGVLEESWNEIVEHKKTNCKNLQNTMYIDDDCGIIIPPTPVKKTTPVDVNNKKRKCEIIDDDDS